MCRGRSRWEGWSIWPPPPCERSWAAPPPSTALDLNKRISNLISTVPSILVHSTGIYGTATGLQSWAKRYFCSGLSPFLSQDKFSPLIDYNSNRFFISMTGFFTSKSQEDKLQYNVCVNCFLSNYRYTFSGFIKGTLSRDGDSDDPKEQ
jgi:hypothetical protein